MGRTSFGLTPKDKQIFLEQIFGLMYYMGFSYIEAYNIPIWQRRWFIERTQKELNRTNDGENSAGSRAMHQNSPDVRQLMNRHRDMVPAKLRRFT